MYSLAQLLWWLLHVCVRVTDMDHAPVRVRVRVLVLVVVDNWEVLLM